MAAESLGLGSVSFVATWMVVEAGSQAAWLGPRRRCCLCCVYLVSSALCLLSVRGVKREGAAGLGTGSIGVGVGLEETQDWKFLVGAGPQRGPRWWPLRRRWEWGLALASWGAIQGKDV